MSVLSLREYKMWFAYALRFARKSHKHTQKDLSLYLRVRQACISDWENYKRGLPTLYQIYLLEQLYGRAYFVPGEYLHE